MADVMTFEEHRGRSRAHRGLDRRRNNVLASWVHAAQRFGFRTLRRDAAGLAPKKMLKDWIKSTGAGRRSAPIPRRWSRGADCVVTDTWVSMGDKEAERRHNMLKPYQVNAR
jgi:ornithine carbamoyltransferase